MRLLAALFGAATVWPTWYDSTALTEETRPQSNESCLIRIRLQPDPRVAGCSLPRFQFSLAWLLIAVTVVAIVMGLASSFRDFVGIASLRQCLLRPADSIRDLPQSSAAATSNHLRSAPWFRG